jgi:putative transposase
MIAQIIRANQFNQERHLVSRDIYEKRRSAALAEWRRLAS